MRGSRIHAYIFSYFFEPRILDSRGVFIHSGLLFTNQKGARKLLYLGATLLQSQRLCALNGSCKNLTLDIMQLVRPRSVCRNDPLNFLPRIVVHQQSR